MHLRGWVGRARARGRFVEARPYRRPGAQSSWRRKIPPRRSLRMALELVAETDKLTWQTQIRIVWLGCWETRTASTRRWGSARDGGAQGS